MISEKRKFYAIIFCIIFSIKQYMQFCELVKCGGEVVIIISHRLEINQTKLGGDFCKKR